MAVHPLEKRAYLEASPAQREVARRLLCNVLCLLQAQSLSYQTSHWQVSGSSSYGNHLLFQRLYGSVQGQIDQLGEKVVGYLGIQAVSIAPRIQHIGQYCARWSTIECHHKRGIQSEKDCQASISAAYEGIKAAQAMTLGLDDWLMATASAHEESQYLLQQALSSPPGKSAAVEPAAPTAEGFFRPNPRKEEVAEFAETGAITNDTEVAEAAAQEDHLDISEAEAVGAAEEAPPTPSEIVKGPGGDTVSTLNRYVVESEDPATNEAALAVTRTLMGAWLLEIERRGNPAQCGG